MTTIDEEDWDGATYTSLLPRKPPKTTTTTTTASQIWEWAPFTSIRRGYSFTIKWAGYFRDAYVIFFTDKGFEPGWSNRPKKNIWPRILDAAKFLRRCRDDDETPLDKCESCGGDMDDLSLSNNVKLPRCLSCGKPGHAYRGYP